MAIYELKDFSDIYTAVREELKIQSGDTTSINRIKRNVNMVYLDEVLPFTRWPWLISSIDLSLPAYFNTGTAAVTQNSRTVTLSSAPTTSRQGDWFSVQGSNKRYKIQSHSAASTTVVLEAPFEDATSSAASFRIWSDYILLPSEARETIEVTRDNLTDPLEGMGWQEFRRLVNQNPKYEDKPMYYHTAEAVDPAPYGSVGSLPAAVSRASAGFVRTLTFASTVASLLTEGERIRVTGAGNNAYNGNWVISSISTTTITFTATESLQESTAADTAWTLTRLGQELTDESTRRIFLYPAMSSTKSTLHVDYLRKAYPLENDADEPLIPLEDRAVLFYGACALSWDRERNQTAADKSEMKFRAKLTKMAGKLEDSTDYAMLMPSKTYLAAKRNPRRRIRRSDD